MLAGATLLAVVGLGACAVPGPVIVVTEAGVITAATQAPVRLTPAAGVSAGAPEVVETYRAPSQVEALEAQHVAVERRISALQQGVTRVRGRQLVTNAIREAVVNRIGSLESRIAALEVEFERRAQRLDTILGELRDQVPTGPDAPDPPPDDPAL